METEKNGLSLALKHGMPTGNRKRGVEHTGRTAYLFYYNKGSRAVSISFQLGIQRNENRIWRISVACIYSG